MHDDALADKYQLFILELEDFDEALLAAEVLVAAGTQVIELCGGFSTQEATELRRRFPDCDIGRVTYP